MYKRKEILNKTLIAYDSGKIVARVKELIYDTAANQVLGLLVARPSLMAKGQYIPFSEVQTIGGDVVTIRSEASLLPIDSDSKIERIVKHQLDLVGHKVISEAGEVIGKISDLCFSQQGQISGYEVSAGALNDAYAGSSFLPAEKISKIGEEVVFVAHSVKAFLDDQVGGLKARVDKVKEKVKIGVESATATVQDKASYGMEYMDTAVAEPVSRVKERFTENLPAKRQKASDNLESLWDTLKIKAGKLKDQASQSVEDQRIKGALGRPVTRVILDQQDKVILNTGELITHQAIERARQNQALDILLSSVYTEKPKFNEDQLKTDQ